MRGLVERPGSTRDQARRDDVEREAAFAFSARYACQSTRTAARSGWRQPRRSQFRDRQRIHSWTLRSGPASQRPLLAFRSTDCDRLSACAPSSRKRAQGGRPEAGRRRAVDRHRGTIRKSPRSRPARGGTLASPHGYVLERARHPSWPGAPRRCAAPAGPPAVLTRPRDSIVADSSCKRCSSTSARRDAGLRSGTARRDALATLAMVPTPPRCGKPPSTRSCALRSCKREWRGGGRDSKRLLDILGPKPRKSSARFITSASCSTSAAASIRRPAPQRRGHSGGADLQGFTQRASRDLRRPHGGRQRRQPAALVAAICACGTSAHRPGGGLCSGGRDRAPQLPGRRSPCAIR